MLLRHHHEKVFERAVPFGMFLILRIDAQKGLPFAPQFGGKNAHRIDGKGTRQSPETGKINDSRLLAEEGEASLMGAELRF